MESVKHFLNKVIDRCGKIFKKPSWWIVFPQEGKPLILSVWEFAAYFLICGLLLYCFLRLNDIPHHPITIEINKLSDYRYIKHKSFAPDSVYSLYFQRSNLDLTIPMVYNRKSQSDNVISLRGDIIEDSMTITTTIVPFNENPPINVPPYLPPSIKNRMMLLTKTSTYWNVVFDRILRQNDNLPDPAPNESVNTNFISIRDTYNIANPISNNYLDSCYKVFIPIIKESDKSQLNNNYYIALATSHNIAKQKGPWLVDSEPDSIFESIFYVPGSNTLSSIWGESYSAYRKVHKSNVNSREIFNRNSFSHFFNRYNGYSESIDGINWFSPDNVGFTFPVEKEDKKDFLTINASDKSGWFSLQDISQGHYDICLRAQTIDSIQLTINFWGAVDIWPSVEPDEKTGNCIKYTNQLKLLKIKTQGLDLYYQSKELANKHYVKVFIVTALLSGIVIILLTFVILFIARVVKSKFYR